MKFSRSLVYLIALIVSASVEAQTVTDTVYRQAQPKAVFSPRTDSARKQALPKVATILLPLSLDSVFSGYQMRTGTGLPRYILPYLEFYNGVQLAVEELNRQRITAQVQVIDSRRSSNIADVLDDYDVKRSGLLIGVGRDADDIRQMTAFAKKQNIPFVSATYPNDAGVESKGAMGLLNTTIQTHVDGLANYLKRNQAASNPVVFTRRGSVEGTLNSWLSQSYGRKMTTSTLADSFSTRLLMPYLDSNKTNVVVVTSLDTRFAEYLLKQLGSLTKSYDIIVAGMPTWDEIDLRRKEYRGLKVVYGTPFVALSTNVDLHRSLSDRFEEIAGSRPSDMALKGYDITYRMVKQLAASDSIFASSFKPDTYSFSQWAFKPIYSASDGSILFFENQKLYFVRKEDGLVKGIY